ncbi:uncharacterized protein LOC131996132 [Stomoxys calcitrans]|uniref:uncharacterized protein LOC131996132 n=1 Tax=Stomoxys calcitrans TaxID=35570 RepID=UPI0027E23175|nr:uncharacterized protein LOC131996132 [Stomoxys calcitrans]
MRNAHNIKLSTGWPRVTGRAHSDLIVILTAIASREQFLARFHSFIVGPKICPLLFDCLFDLFFSFTLFLEIVIVLFLFLVHLCRRCRQLERIEQFGHICDTSGVKYAGIYHSSSVIHSLHHWLLQCAVGNANIDLKEHILICNWIMFLLQIADNWSFLGTHKSCHITTTTTRKWLLLPQFNSGISISSHVFLKANHSSKPIT